MSVNNAGQIPWRGQMRQLRAAQTTEWMAPDDVVEQVRAQYLEAITWLTDTTLSSWAQQWAQAPARLSGACLKRQRRLVLNERSSKGVQFVGVVRADHVVEVRQFSETGSFCLVIDYQSQRRMATYNRRTRERLHTQDLGDGIVVYAMRYDAVDQRWKIDSFVQELPPGWRSNPLIQEFTILPGKYSTVGRDY
jgi:hypothetical protein